MAQALEDKILALQQAHERERRFTSDVAHELRTPLTALVGEASLLKEHLDELPSDARRPAQMLIADVARLRRLVEELMEISRLGSGREVVRAEPVDLAALIRGVLGSRGWSERVRVQLEPLQLDTDRRRMERIVANLVGNALDHGRGQVWVRTGTEHRTAFVQVTDDGKGIPQADLPHIFEPFYKADPSRTGQGSGLGLAIARENARLLGGDIEVWSQPGKGTRFTVRLPTAVTEPLRQGESAVSGPPDHDRVVREGGDRP
jgi:two-component system sensor histidine kinase MtrB